MSAEPRDPMSQSLSDLITQSLGDWVICRRVAAWVVVVAVALPLAGCLEPRERPQAGACTRCHGDASRGGSALRQAAPPVDLTGQTDPRFPGVGAHDRHLDPSATHGPVACAECHRVPSAVAEPGHAETTRATITFGTLAAKGGRTPSYDAEALRCSGSYCHRAATPRWTEPRSPADACGSCHGLPPPAPHPQWPECYRCHGEVIGADGRFVAPEKHVDGVVQAQASCRACHGSEASPAPPRDLAGQTSTAAIGVGAHATHLAGGVASRPVPCGACHLVPAVVGDAGHLGALPAEVTFAEAAVAGGRKPSWDRAARRCADTWCHGPAAPAPSPDWTAPGTLGCTGCHGMPPPAPHPQLANCTLCHAAVVDADKHISQRALHVNGVVDVKPPTACNACHGTGPLGAPPPALDGTMSAAAVGAHQTHLAGTVRSRAVACSECHQVPASVLSPGHLDSALPAELTFSGVAMAFTAKPSFDGQGCKNSYCHGLGSLPSGGTLPAPLWSAPPGTQAYCGSCHGLPPPAPHPASTTCWTCHANLTPNYQFVDPQKHVNGQVDFL
jgi:predicted CxxxxCH...CXXCH cytochrome family protein